MSGYQLRSDPKDRAITHVCVGKIEIGVVVAVQGTYQARRTTWACPLPADSYKRACEAVIQAYEAVQRSRPRARLVSSIYA